jgi:hypothetical protein
MMCGTLLPGPRKIGPPNNRTKFDQIRKDSVHYFPYRWNSFQNKKNGIENFFLPTGLHFNLLYALFRQRFNLSLAQKSKKSFLV